MTKREAQRRVDVGDLTWGHLKQAVAECFDDEMASPSIVNPSMTHGQSLDILRAGMESREDNELVQSPRYTERRNAAGFLAAVNVLRETSGRLIQEPR